DFDNYSWQNHIYDDMLFNTWGVTYQPSIWSSGRYSMGTGDGFSRQRPSYWGTGDGHVTFSGTGNGNLTPYPGTGGIYPGTTSTGNGNGTLGHRPTLGTGDGNTGTPLPGYDDLRNNPRMGTGGPGVSTSPSWPVPGG